MVDEIEGRAGAWRMKKDWEKFKTFKERGEWVELKFMAEAALHGYHVLKPWGDSLSYDVGIDHKDAVTRVQVKGFSARKGGGYLCRLRHGGSGKQSYNPHDLDLFAIYIIPVAAWYLIPSAAILLPTPKMYIRFYPIAPPRPGRHTRDHDYEPYREAWHLLDKTRGELCRI
jgi:hypothetical protein